MLKLGEVIIAPVVSEKSNLTSVNNTYVFKVHQNASKIQIRQAIEKFFGVKVKKVNTLQAEGKRRVMGRFVGSTASHKKAFVKLVPGHKIEAFGA